MPAYAYEAMNQAGQEVKDEIEAISTEDALAKIRNLGYFPTPLATARAATAVLMGLKSEPSRSMGRCPPNWISRAPARA